MMKEKLENKELKLNTDLAGHKAGSVIRIKYKNGIPVDHYWRNRLEDSAVDGCVSLVTKEVPVKEEQVLQTKSKSGKKE